jgi:hypothetical protein
MIARRLSLDTQLEVQFYEQPQQKINFFIIDWTANASAQPLKTERGILCPFQRRNHFYSQLFKMKGFYAYLIYIFVNTFVERKKDFNVHNCCINDIIGHLQPFLR